MRAMYSKKSSDRSASRQHPAFGADGDRVNRGLTFGADRSVSIGQDCEIV